MKTKKILCIVAVAMIVVVVSSGCISEKNMDLANNKCREFCKNNGFMAYKIDQNPSYGGICECVLKDEDLTEERIMSKLCNNLSGMCE